MSCRTGAHALRSAGEQRPRLSAGNRCPAEAGRFVATSPDVALAAPHGGTRNDKAPHVARPQKVVRVFPRCPPKGNQPLAPCCTSLGCSPSRRTTVGRSWSHGLPVFFNDHSTAGWECPGSPEGRPGCGRKRHQQKSPAQWPGFLGVLLHTMGKRYANARHGVKLDDVLYLSLLVHCSWQLK